MSAGTDTSSHGGRAAWADPLLGFGEDLAEDRGNAIELVLTGNQRRGELHDRVTPAVEAAD